ncbi:MAG: hypothetical protein U1E76_10200 [Planctomycetota bacterium]
MAEAGDAPHQRALALGNPAKDEERGAQRALVEQFEEPLDAELDPR